MRPSWKAFFCRISSIFPQPLFGCLEMLLTKSCTEEYPQICGIAASIVTFSEADLIMNHHPNKKYEHNITYRDDNKYHQKFNL